MSKGRILLVDPDATVREIAGARLSLGAASSKASWDDPAGAATAISAESPSRVANAERDGMPDLQLD